jgi:hypothetical protein
VPAVDALDMILFLSVIIILRVDLD